MKRWIFTAASMSQPIRTKSKNLRTSFSELYEEAKTLEDICLDMVVMAPDMIEVLE
jgi:hypothetical protein